MSIFINGSSSLGAVFVYSITNITGSLFVTLLTTILFLFALCLMFNIPVEFTIVIVLPVILVCMAYSGELLSVLGIALLYLAIIFAKMFFLK